MSARLFIRNDDVWTLEPRFRFFFDSAMGHGVPVVHAVIPGKMDQGLARFLLRAKEKTPHLLDIVQHGWVHANHSDQAGLKYEFGAKRSLKSQGDDIDQGQKKMRSAFGESFIPAFVPPYHGYDERTLKVLQGAGFRIFSAGDQRRGSLKKFIELPAQISFTRYDEGKKTIIKAKDMIRLLVKSINRRPISGVVTHHSDFTTEADRRELSRFFKYVAALGAKKEWQAVLFSDLLSE